MMICGVIPTLISYNCMFPSLQVDFFMLACHDEMCNVQSNSKTNMHV